MDGLECSEVLFSKIREKSVDVRLDTEYYQKSIIHVEEEIISRNHFYLRKKDVFTGPFGSTLTAPAHMENGFIPLVRSININQGFYINRNDLVYISKEDNELIRHSQLYEDDIVLSRVGSIGYFARVDSSLKTCNISSNNIGIRLDDYECWTKHYILTYLNTETAKQLVLRLATGNVQPKLTTNDICHLPIPAFSNQFYKFISLLIVKSEKLIIYSGDMYQEAESIFSEKMSIQNIKTDTIAKTVKLLSESYKKTGRLDAEYYQPKYDALFDALGNHSCRPLGGEHGIVKIRKSIEPGSDAYQKEGIPFIRVSDVSKFEISDSDIYLSHDIVSDVVSLFPPQNTILFSKDGSIGIAYKVEKDMQIITSGALLHLHIRNMQEILPDYLTLVLNSPVVQLQAERDSNGAIIQHWKPSEIENVVIPVLDLDIQKEISDKVQESFALRRRSKKLLECAKQAVEMAIVHGEDSALAWLKEKNLLEAKENEVG